MSRTKGAKGKKNKKVSPSIDECAKILTEAKDIIVKNNKKEVCKKIAKHYENNVNAIDQSKMKEELINKGLAEIKNGEVKTIPVISKEQQERQDRLNNTLRDLNKKFGKTSIKFANTIEARGRIPFKNKHLTAFTGGGIPTGTYTCIWGSKGCAKTTMVLDLISVVQKSGGTCAYVNGERSYDPIWAQKRGVDTEKLIVIDVETLEEGLDIVIKLCREKVADLIIFDSLHGIAPKGELYEGKAQTEKSVSQDTMALRARKLTQFFEMATAFVAEAKCAVILIGQSRMDLSGFVKLETLTGGHALLHNCRLIIKLRRGQGADAPVTKEKIKVKELNDEGDEIEKTKTVETKVGFDLVLKIEKSQISDCVEGQDMHIPFFFAEGIKVE